MSKKIESLIKKTKKFIEKSGANPATQSSQQIQIELDEINTLVQSNNPNDIIKCQGNVESYLNAHLQQVPSAKITTKLYVTPLQLKSVELNNMVKRSLVAEMKSHGLTTIQAENIVRSRELCMKKIRVQVIKK